MNIKELKFLIKDLPDNTSVHVPWYDGDLYYDDVGYAEMKDLNEDGSVFYKEDQEMGDKPGSKGVFCIN